MNEDEIVKKYAEELEEEINSINSIYDVVKEFAIAVNEAAAAFKSTLDPRTIEAIDSL